jgi:protein-S-isoprenylcysteine O-methyltransferase Ste14
MTSRLSRAFTILRGVVYAAVFVWLWAWLAILVRPYDASLRVELPRWLRPLGLGLAIAGALLAATCIATFVTRGRGTPAPFDPPREFVVSGPYRWVRNPMYVGAAAVLAGTALALSSPAILLLAVVFLGIMHLFVVLHEEPALAETFGDAYGRYRSSVNRWLIRRPGSTVESSAPPEGRVSG